MSDNVQPHSWRKEELIRMKFANMSAITTSSGASVQNGACASKHTAGTVSSSAPNSSSEPINRPTSEADDDWRYIEVAVVKTNYTWIINNFNSRKEKIGETIRSPTFSTGSNDELKWHLIVYPKGTTKETKEEIFLGLQLYSSNEGEVRARYKVSCLNAKGRKTKITDSRAEVKFFKCKTWTYPIRRDFLFDKAKGVSLLSDKLTIFCEISVVREIVDITEQLSPFQYEGSEYGRLSEDLDFLLRGQKFSDVTLCTGEKEFFAHKAILAARSAVFAAMFEHDTRERRENRVIIEDVDQDVLGEMLRYIYTGQSQNITKMAEGLFVAADKYDLKILKEKCEKVLYTKLTVENAANVLILADSYNIAQLKARAIDFTIEHAVDVIDSAAWKNMVPKYPHLISEAFRAGATRGFAV